MLNVLIMLLPDVVDGCHMVEQAIHYLPAISRLLVSLLKADAIATGIRLTDYHTGSLFPAGPVILCE